MHPFVSNPLFPTSLFVALLCVLAWSLRRRPVDDHPVCRRCGFDLTGRPAGSNVCSECGADLIGRRAIRRGNRQRRWRVARWVVVPLLLAGVWAGRSGWVASRGLDWQSVKPLWWLRLVEARSKNATTRDAAVTEFIRRLSLKRLSDAQVTALADYALDLQADPARPWTSLWGKFLEDAWDAGRLTRDRWERYARQSFDFSLEFRKQVRQGDPLIARISLPRPRTGPGRLVADAHDYLLVGQGPINSFWYGNSRPAGYTAYLRYMTTLGPVQGQDPMNWSRQMRGNQFVPVPGSGFATETGTGDLDPGPHSSSIGFSVDVWDAHSSTVLTRFPVTVQSGWTMLPPDVPSVKLRHEAGLRAAVQASVVAKRVRVSVLRDIPDSPTNAIEAEVDLVSTPAPVARSFEVWLRGRSKESKLQEQLPQLVRKGERDQASVRGRFMWRFSAADLRTEFGEPGAATADVILRPTFAPAVRTMDVFDIWGEDIVLRNVPVTFVGAPPNRGQEAPADSSSTGPDSHPAAPASTRTSSWRIDDADLSSHAPGGYIFEPNARKTSQGQAGSRNAPHGRRAAARPFRGSSG